jgi:hypothetical protein
MSLSFSNPIHESATKFCSPLISTQLQLGASSPREKEETVQRFFHGPDAEDRSTPMGKPLKR